MAHPLISWGKNTKKIRYIILLIVVYSCYIFPFYSIILGDRKYEYGIHPLFYSWLRYLSQFVIIVLYLIRQWRIKEKSIIPKPNKKYSKIKLLGVIYCLFLCDLFSMLSLYVASTKNLVYRFVFKGLFLMKIYIFRNYLNKINIYLYIFYINEPSIFLIHPRDIYRGLHFP